MKGTIRGTGLGPFTTRVHRIVYQDRRGIIIFVSGKLGSGKSTFMLKFGNDFDVETNGTPRFYLSWIKRIFKSVSELIDAITSGEYPIGSVFCLEEGGININNQAWYSEVNKGFRRISTLLRYKRYVVIINARSKEIIDNQTRQLIDFEVEAIRIDFANNRNVIKIKELEYNTQLKKFYEKRFRTRFGNIITQWRYIPPPKEQLDAYTTWSEGWKDSLIGDTGRKLRALEHIPEKVDEKLKLQQEKEARIREEREIALRTKQDRVVREDKAVNELFRDITEKRYESIAFKKTGFVKRLDRDYVLGHYGLTESSNKKVCARLKAALKEQGIIVS